VKSTEDAIGVKLSFFNCADETLITVKGDKDSLKLEMRHISSLEESERERVMHVLGSKLQS